MSGNAARELRRVAGNLNYIWNISIFTKICREKLVIMDVVTYIYVSYLQSLISKLLRF